MKKLIVLLLAVLLLTGCSQVPDPPETTAPESTATTPPTEAQVLPSTEAVEKPLDTEPEEKSSEVAQPSEAELPTEAAKPAESNRPTAKPIEATTPPTEAPTAAPTEAPTSPPTEAPTEPPTEPPTETVRWDTESAVASICAQTNTYAESVGMVVDSSCGSWITPLCTRGIDQSWALTYCLDYIDFLYSGDVKATRVYCTYAHCPDCNDGWAIYVYY